MNIQFNPSLEKLKNIFQNAPVGVIEISCEGEIINANRKGNEFYMQLQQAYCCSSASIFNLFACIDPQIMSFINQPSTKEKVLYKKDIIFCIPPNEEGKETCFTITLNKPDESSIVLGIENSTERYHREKTIQKSELEKAVAQGKYEIASEVLHDIGNAVVGFGAYLNRVNRMLDKNKPDNLNNVAVFIKKVQPQIAVSLGADKANALVTLLEGIHKNEKENKEELRRSVAEQLNIVSHIQEILSIQRQYVTGRQETGERKPISLRQVIDDCLAMLFASFDKKKIQVTTYVDSETTPVVKGDRTKLMQVLLNLLKNSVEAIDEEAPVKKIEIQLQSGNDAIDLEIKDTGKGFDAETGSRFFERGYTTKNTGTGLGLHNCRQILEAHSGTIQMHSNGIGQGAVTQIRFQL